MGDCDGFSSPDQFRAASPKTLPSTQSARGWITVSSSIPALHRLHGNPVSNFDCTPDQRLQQRRFWSANQLAIAGNVQTQLPQVLFEAFAPLSVPSRAIESVWRFMVKVASNGTHEALSRSFGITNEEKDDNHRDEWDQSRNDHDGVKRMASHRLSCVGKVSDELESDDSSESRRGSTDSTNSGY